MRIITTDARLFEGKLEGFDGSTNVILSNCIERILTNDDNEYQQIDIGVYVMRGTNVVCIGEVEEEEQIDWKSLRGKLKSTKNTL